MNEDYLAIPYTISREEFLGNSFRAFGGSKELSLVVRDFIEIDDTGNPPVVDENPLLLDAEDHLVDLAEALETY